jgi:hypothetical protein
MPMQVFRCNTCGLLWTDKQVKKAEDKTGKQVFVCPQDGNKVYDATRTKRGKRFISIMENQNADQV